MNKFMMEAIKEAELGIRNGHGGPFGCVIVKDGIIIGRGHNKVILNNDPTCHGEMEAIRETCREIGSFDLSGYELYTTGEPCPMCLGAIMWANIDKVYYGCNIDDTEIIGFRDKRFYNFIKEEKKICSVLDREECLKLYDEYNNIKDKRNY